MVFELFFLLRDSANQELLQLLKFTRWLKNVIDKIIWWLQFGCTEKKKNPNYSINNSNILK